MSIKSDEFDLCIAGGGGGGSIDSVGGFRRDLVGTEGAEPF